MATPERLRPWHGSISGIGPKAQLMAVEPPPWAEWKWRNETSRVVRWIETYARIPTGHNAGRLMRVAPFQRQIIADTYGALAAFCSTPAANGKTTLLGAIALERICRGDDYAEVDVIATKLEQAGEVLQIAARIAEASPELRTRLAYYARQDELRYRPTGSRIRAQSARLKTLEGLNFSLGIVDEVGFAGDDQIESLLARLGKRADAHLLGIGTPGFEPNLLWRLRRDWLEDALPPHVSYREWAGPEGCDINDRHAWRQANPALGAGFLGVAALELQAGIFSEAKFRIYHLGQWVDQADAWLPAGAWDDCPHELAPPDGAEVVLAVEGTYQRTVAVVGATLDGAVFHVWAAERATDAELAHILDSCLERWTVRELTHNRRVRARLFATLASDGAPVRPWGGDGLDIEAGSANELYRAIVDKRIAHDHHELIANHVANLRVRRLADGSLRLVRPETGEHCDAALAARNAWWRAGELAAQPAGPPIIY